MERRIEYVIKNIDNLLEKRESFLIAESNLKIGKSIKSFITALQTTE